MNAVHTRSALRSEIRAILAFDAYAAQHPERERVIVQAIDRGECLVVDAGGKILGYAVLNHAFFENGFVSLVVVAPEARRRGVASSLIRSAEAACTSDKLYSSTNASNVAGRALLEKLGFVRSGEVQNLDAGDAEYIYLRRLRGHEG